MRVQKQIQMQKETRKALSVLWMMIALFCSSALMADTQETIGASTMAVNRTLMSDGLEKPTNTDFNRVPASLIQVSERFSSVLWVELEEGLLHLLQRQENADVWKSVLSRPVSIGKAGSGKQLEGDNKTPIGIYSVRDLIADEELIDFYGFGAFPLSYPNNWDRRLGRTGFGIWLHGLPKSVQSRPRLDSEGCVVIDNKTLSWMADYIEPASTRIVTGAKLNWSNVEKSKELRDELRARITDWLSAWSANDAFAYLDFYHPTFSDGTRNLDQWAAYKTGVNAAKSWIDVAATDVSIFGYPGACALVVVEYRQRYKSSNYNHEGRKVLFWRRDAHGQWRIIYEGSGQL